MSSHNRGKTECKTNPKPGISVFGRPRKHSNIDEADPGVGGSSEAEAGMDALSEQIQKLQAEKQELMNTLVRRQADFENYRKRVEKERHHDRHRARGGADREHSSGAGCVRPRARHRGGFGFGGISEGIRDDSPPAFRLAGEAGIQAHRSGGQGIQSAFSPRHRTAWKRTSTRTEW